MTDHSKHLKSENPVEMALAMPEPLGRLGTIVRRMKQMQPVLPPPASAAIRSGERDE
ncbi:MAG TPA: hypothetical protein VGM68_08770 [Rhizomicrobium sp.]|jgi:hypothetical protein